MKEEDFQRTIRKELALNTLTWIKIEEILSTLTPEEKKRMKQEKVFKSLIWELEESRKKCLRFLNGC